MSFETEKEPTGFEKELIDVNYHDIRELLDAKGLQQVKSVGRKKKDIIVEALSKYDEVKKLQLEEVPQEEITEQLQEEDDKKEEAIIEQVKIEASRIPEYTQLVYDILVKRHVVDGKLDTTALNESKSKVESKPRSDKKLWSQSIDAHAKILEDYK